MTARRPTSFDSKWLIGVLLILVAGITSADTIAHAEECLAAPNSPARDGTRWHYRLDWATQHKCWYMREIDQPTQQVSRHAVSALPPPPLATPIPQPGPPAIGSLPVSRGNPAQSSSNRDEVAIKTIAAPPVGELTPDTSSSIPQELTSQRTGTSLAAPVLNAAPGNGAAPDETTSVISEMHQAASATAVAPHAEILAGAATDETGSPNSNITAPPQAASSSELNAQAAAMDPNEIADLTDERIDSPVRWVAPLYFIVAFLLALVVQLFIARTSSRHPRFRSADGEGHTQRAGAIVEATAVDRLSKG
jgi:hypothetical protein